MNAKSPHKWWSTLKSAVCQDRVRHYLFLLVVMHMVDWCASRLAKADLVTDHFDGKQSRESVDLPLTCHPSPRLITIAFRSIEGIQTSLVRVGPL